MKYLLLFVFAVIATEGAYEGDLCDSNGVSGICKNLRKCPSALDDIKNRRPPPQTCGWEGNDPIVCCRNGPIGTTTQRPVLTTTKRTTMNKTAEYIPIEYEYEIVGNQDGCDSIPPFMTSNKTGQKAWDKCIEYQEKYVYPCDKVVELTGGYRRLNHCHHNADELIVRGPAAAKFDFPHMVLLGYLNDQKTIDWDCGGTLISEKFVLTAGHCISNKLRNNVSHALIGALKRSEDADSKRYGIKRIIKHDNYHSPVKYNDIALLELDKEVPLDHTTVPACLHTGDSIDDSRAEAIGWGTTLNNKESNVYILLKVTLSKFANDECSDKYEVNKQMERGVDTKSQICYGDKYKSKDICQGDSGGPLQVRSKEISCMYTIIGVTSISQTCGGIPGIYTRVSNYLPWIESIVWPN